MDTSTSTQWNTLRNAINRSRRAIKSRPRILLLCAGPDDRFDGLTQMIKASGFDCENYDTANGAHLDITDDSVSDPLAARVAGGEFVAAFASPDCSTYSKLHNLPGPPPLRDAEGTGRYGRTGLKPKQQERVRMENSQQGGRDPRALHRALAPLDIRSTRGVRTPNFHSEPGRIQDPGRQARSQASKRRAMPV